MSQLMNTRPWKQPKFAMPKGPFEFEIKPDHVKFAFGATKQLNTLFKSAAAHSDWLRCRELLAKGAYPDGQIDGESALEQAIGAQDLTRCKSLIDMGVTLSDAQRQTLIDLLTEAEVLNQFARQMFFAERPPHYEPQIFIDGKFHSLKDSASHYLQHPGSREKDIVLINVGDEAFNQFYGAVTRKLLDSFAPFYSEIARHFTVVRTFTDTTDQLGGIIQKVKQLLPGRPIAHMALDGHGNVKLIHIGSGVNGRLTVNRGEQWAAIVDLLDPETILSFWGCNNGAGDKKNVLSQLSQSIQGRMLAGSGAMVEGTVPKTFYSEALKKHVLLFFFKKGQKQQVKIYSQGRCFIWDSLTENGEITPALKEAVEARLTRQRTPIAGVNSLLIKDYF